MKKDKRDRIMTIRFGILIFFFHSCLALHPNYLSSLPGLRITVLGGMTA